MKKITCAIAAATALFSQAAFANTCHSFPGITQCTTGRVESIHSSGSVTLNGTTVLKGTLVNGVINAEDSKFSGLEVNGSAKLAQCTINHNAIIRGLLKAFNTRFQKELTVYSDKIFLTNSLVKRNLHIVEGKKAPVVHLNESSKIEGNVIFDAKNPGVVFIAGGSVVSGKIINGEIVKQ